MNPIVSFDGDVSYGQTCPETITRSYIVSDDCGNETVITQLIVVNDITAPTASAPVDIQVSCHSDIPAANPSIISATDNCSSNVVVAHTGGVSDGLSCPKTITRNYSLVDDCGNTSQVQQTIIVNDEVAPTINCTISTDTILASEGNLLENYTSNANVSDNCSNNLNVVQSPAPGSSLSLGNNTVTLSVTDECGNESSYTINVVYEDDASIEDYVSLPVSLFPNPTSGQLTIDFGAEVNDAEISLYVASGKLILNDQLFGSTSKHTIDLSVYAKGLYTIVLVVNNVQTVHKISKL